MIVVGRGCLKFLKPQKIKLMNFWFKKKVIENENDFQFRIQTFVNYEFSYQADILSLFEVLAECKTSADFNKATPHKPRFFPTKLAISCSLSANVQCFSKPSHQ